MTITNVTQYNQKKTEFETKYTTFITEYDRLKSQPCGNYNSMSRGLNSLCLNEVWKQSGCDKPSPYNVVNSFNNTLYDKINDAYKWSSFIDTEHPKTGCYTNAAAVADTTKTYNINGIQMKTVNASTFTKDGVGITASSLDDCKEKCLPETGCISATYNLSSKKCWTNIGSLSEWKEPSISTDTNDVAIYYELVQLLNQLVALNKELHDYEVANPTSGSGAGAGTTDSTCTQSTCAAAGQGGCKAPCSWNQHGYCTCGGTGGSGPVTSTESESGTGFESGSSMPGILDTVLQIAPTVISSLFGSANNNPPPHSVNSNEFAALKQKVGVIDTDRIATAKTLEEYKKQFTEMSKKQDDANADLKKQMITIALITVVGILLIFLLSAMVQSMNSGSNNSFSGGGLRKLGSWKNMIFRKK